MNCPHCKSENIGRVRRRTLWDNLKSSMGRWPYTCDDCALRFSAASRFGPDRRNAEATDAAGLQTAQQSGPEMAYRNNPVRPVAKVVIQADDQAQLENILLALDRAVSHYQQPVKEHTTAQ